MTVKQITIEMPNRPGQLATISELLGEAGINILALFVSTKTPGGAGLMRFVANDPDRAEELLRAKGYQVESQEVIAAETPHHAGGLQAFLNPLKREDINVQYVYPCIQTGEATILILGADDTKRAIAALQKDWIRIYGEELYQI